jgi:hypothetical protein
MCWKEIKLEAGRLVGVFFNDSVYKNHKVGDGTEGMDI